MAGRLRPGDEDDRLHRFGLAIEPATSATYAGAIRVGQRIHASGGRTIGLLPVGLDTAVPGVALQIGAGLVDSLGATVAIVDTNARYPAFAGLADETPDDGTDSPFKIHWIRGALALLTPRNPTGNGIGVAELESLSTLAGSMFAHVLVDLTGFESFGLQFDAVRLLDKVIVLARAGSASDWDLIRTCRQLPPWKDLGVLLIG